MLDSMRFNPYEALDSEQNLPASAVKAALSSLGGKLVEALQQSEESQVARASMAVGLLGVYVDGFQLLYALDLKEHWSEAQHTS